MANYEVFFLFFFFVLFFTQHHGPGVMVESENVILTINCHFMKENVIFKANHNTWYSDFRTVHYPTVCIYLYFQEIGLFKGIA